MLKIKNDIDLKELDKYGFKHNGEHDFIKHSNTGVVHLSVNEYTRFIGMLTSGGWRDDLDILYDLIKDGLVEKID